MKNRWFYIGWKLLTAAASLTGVTIAAVGSKDLAALFSFYTLQSNLVVSAVFLILGAAALFCDPREKAWYIPLKGAGTMCIAVTFAVYYLMLAPQMFTMSSDYTPWNLMDILLHGLTPLLAIADYFIFDVKGRMKAHHPFFWMIPTLAYPVFAYIYSAAGGVFGTAAGAQKYPYFFMDVTRYGILGVALWMAGIVVVYFGICYLVVLLDKRLGRKKDAKAHSDVEARG